MKKRCGKKLGWKIPSGEKTGMKKNLVGEQLRWERPGLEGTGLKQTPGRGQRINDR